MRTRVLFMSTSSLSKVSFDVSPVVSYKNWSSPPWNLTWMTTIFLALWFYRRVDGVDLAAYGAQQLGASTASTRRKSLALAVSGLSMASCSVRGCEWQYFFAV